MLSSLNSNTATIQRCPKQAKYLSLISGAAYWCDFRLLQEVKSYVSSCVEIGVYWSVYVFLFYEHVLTEIVCDNQFFLIYVCETSTIYWFWLHR